MDAKRTVKLMPRNLYMVLREHQLWVLLKE